LAKPQTVWKGCRKADELEPDLVLLDIGLPTINGIEAARQIRTHCPNSRIIFVTQESGEHFVQEAFRIGAMAYVTKRVARKELLPAVDAVLDGKQFVSGGLTAQEFTTQPPTVYADQAAADRALASPNGRNSAAGILNRE
jgi:DNA-binding NarL/FixJ family response regulator